MHLARRHVRYVVAAASATMAGIYFLIGLGVLDIGGTTTPEQVDVGAFGASAGSSFLTLAVVALVTDRRWIWIVAAVCQVFVYVIYVNASSVRVPPFEIVGITLRILQLPLLVALVYLSVKAPEDDYVKRRASDAAAGSV